MPKNKEEIEVEEQELFDEPIGTNDEEESNEDLEDFSAMEHNSLASLDHDDLFSSFDPNEEDDIEAELSNPNITRLDDPPLVGGTGRGSDLFGNRSVHPSGRAISPRLYSQAAQFPSCSQLRVWKWENGVPVGLGAIDAMATEEDMVKQFMNAMPKKGEGRCQFKLRPIDINGGEMGTEINIIISEHHAAIQRIRKMKEAEKEEEYSSRRRSPYEDEEYGFAPHFDRIMGTAEKRAELLEQQLEGEREDLRRREEQRMQEQVDLATNAAQGVQVLTQRMMEDEAKRAERAMAVQTEQSQTLITTLTSIFAQQQSQMNTQAEAQRRADEYRLEQERQRATRERQDAEDRRHRERLELEERRRRETEEYDRKMQTERENSERRLMRDQKEMELRLQRERESMHMKMQREKDEREARERWFNEERLRREHQNKDDARQREMDRQRQHEMMMAELKASQQRDREHAERIMILSKQELQSKAMGGLGEMLPVATGFLSKMGLEPTDVMQKLFAPEPVETQSGWGEAIPKLLGVAGDVARVALAGKTGVAPVVPSPQMLPMQQEDERYYDEVDYREEMARMRQHETIPPQPHYPQQPEYQVPPEGGVISYKQTKLGHEEVPPIPQERVAPTTLDQARKAGLTLADQRDARNAMSALVRTLHTSDQSAWQEILTEALVDKPVIYQYTDSVTVRSAIQETGADEVLTENIITALKASSLVPPDINYGA